MPGRSHSSGSQNQATALRGEDVRVTVGTLGELMVDFAKFGWFPRSLPSESGGVEESSDEDDDGEREISYSDGS